MLKAFLKLTNQERKVIFLASLGGALEFYDFIIYIFFARILGELFFPHKIPLAALMGVFAVFAIGYLIRPLGGIIFSHYGDKYGRKKTFMMTLVLMALPTFLIGCLPTSETLGVGAAVLLVLLRILQGLSVGGEIPGAVTFAGEHVDKAQRGLTCGIIFLGLNMGMLLGSFISLFLTTLLSHEQLLSWGWRIPFIFGGILGIISFYLRKRMTETPVFQQFYKETHSVKLPLFALKQYWPRLLQGIALTWLGAVTVCLLFLYMPTYLSDILNYPKILVDRLNTLNILFFSFVIVFGGWLSDNVGRKIILLIGAGGFLLLSYELFFLLSQKSSVSICTALISFSLLGGCIAGVYPCTLIELFPTKVRYTGMAVAYNIGFAVFGGLAPLLATYLIKITGSHLAPSFYLMISALVGFIAALTLTHKSNESLMSYH